MIAWLGNELWGGFYLSVYKQWNLISEALGHEHLHNA